MEVVAIARKLPRAVPRISVVDLVEPPAIRPGPHIPLGSRLRNQRANKIPDPT